MLEEFSEEKKKRNKTKRKVVSLHFLTLLNHILKEKKKRKQTTTTTTHTPTFPPTPHHTWIHCSQNTAGSAVILTSPHSALHRDTQAEAKSQEGRRVTQGTLSCLNQRHSQDQNPQVHGVHPTLLPTPNFMLSWEEAWNQDPHSEGDFWQTSHMKSRMCSCLSNCMFTSIHVEGTQLFARIEKIHGFASEIFQFLPAKSKSQRPGLFLWHCWG